ncbi:MAG: tetratricopeptide repeat protein [Gemmataceae bacterium]|nr:tetratricopeptide repeat protein [Gemmataceae bacterium]
MAKKRKQPARRSKATDRRLRDALDQVDALIARRQWAEARTRLDNLLRTYPQHEEILRNLAEVAFHLKDAHTFQYSCEMLYAQCPQDRHLPYMLTMAYVQNGWLSLALAMARRAVAQDPANENAAGTRKLLVELEPLVHAEVTRLGLDGADGLECLTLHDQVRSFLAQGRYAKAREVADQLAQRRPQFAPAYNNGAEACYHDGRLAPAIDLEQRLLAFEPENVFALANLVRFLVVAGKVEEAQRHADRLKALQPPNKELVVKQAEALSCLGDDLGVLAVCERGRQLTDPGGPEDNALLYHLAAVAAYRQGREEDARTCWMSALRAVPHFELARDNLDDLKRPVGERNAPWSYPFKHFVPKKLIEGLLTRMASVHGPGADEAVRRDPLRYLEVHPEIEGLVPLLLDRSDRAGRELALRLVGLFRTPGMLQAVRDFALGQRGADALRLQAAELAQAAGLLPAGPSRLWLGGEWHGGVMQRFEIHGDPVERTHAPGVFDLLTQGVTALREGHAARAEQALRQALAIDPDDPVVMNNLAVACAQLGRTDESEAISIRLHERHPDYLFGRTALANLAAERGEFERARKLLEPLLTRSRMHVGEFAALCMAQINLYLAEGNREQARHWLGMWRQVTPDHPALGGFESRLRRGR